MPRFTLRQLLTGVLLSCVYLAVLREAFSEVRHVAVSFVTWAILAAFYFKWRAWITLIAHSVSPLMVILSSLYLLVVSGFPTRTWRFHVFDESFGVLVLSCGVSSLLIFPMAILGLVARYLQARPSP